MNFNSISKAFQAGLDHGSAFPNQTEEKYKSICATYLNEESRDLPYLDAYEKGRKGPQEDWKNSGYRIMPCFHQLIAEFVDLYNEMAEDRVNRHEAINFALYEGMEGICRRIEAMKQAKALQTDATSF